jgi:uncharacterized membrane protein (DUF485 family)
MAGFGHGPSHPAELEDAAIVARNARYGMALFAIYLLFYGGFVLMAAFRPAWLAHPAAGGVNVAISYGMTLIVGALVLALFYAWLCRGGSSVNRTTEPGKEQP